MEVDATSLAPSSPLPRSLLTTHSGVVPLVPPAYLLEKQVRISVFQLYVPLPGWLSGALPSSWSAGVELEDGEGGRDSVAVVAFELPRVGAVDAFSVLPAALVRVLEESVGSVSSLSQLPRDLFVLRVPLPCRIEAAKVSVRAFADHVAVRLPLFYAGSALPDRPQSLVTLEEAAAAREHGRRLACRACGGGLLEAGAGGASDGSSSSSSSAPARMRAHLLPGEYWLEWSDYWMCHEQQDNAFLPREGEALGALRGALLLGETFVAVHPRDVRDDAVSLVPMEAADDLGPARSQCALLGTASATLEEPQRRALAASVASGGTATLRDVATACARGGESPWQWPDRVAANLPLVLKLFKDRCALPPRATGQRNEPGPELGAFAPYSVCARVAHALIAAAHAHSQYRFVVSIAPALSLRDIAAAAAAEDSGGGGGAPQPPLQPRLLLALINWDTSIRGRAHEGTAGAPEPWHGERSPATAAPGGAARARRGELPAVKLRYRALPAPGPERDAMLLAAGARRAPEVIALDAREVAELERVLRASSRLLPPSARRPALGDDDALVGFLPLRNAMS